MISNPLLIPAALYHLQIFNVGAGNRFPSILSKLSEPNHGSHSSAFDYCHHGHQYRLLICCSIGDTCVGSICSLSRHLFFRLTESHSMPSLRLPSLHLPFGRSTPPPAVSRGPPPAGSAGAIPLPAGSAGTTPKPAVSIGDAISGRIQAEKASLKSHPFTTLKKWAGHLGAALKFGSSAAAAFRSKESNDIGTALNTGHALADRFLRRYD